MKNFKIYLFLFLLGLIFFFVSGKFQNSTFTFSSKSLPFPPPTEASVSHGDIRIGVEKIVKEKYFITYSEAEGNPSYLGIYLIIENLKKEKLNNEDFISIGIVDNLGNSYKPLPYCEIKDFPEDLPLGWKLISFSKFLPVSEKASFINIDVKFGKDSFTIKKVNLP